jgi:hypothetical protein
LLSQQRSAAELCREHVLSPSFLPTWKDTALSGLEQSHIAELEQLVGRQTLELEIVNKSLQAAPCDRGHQKMLPT